MPVLSMRTLVLLYRSTYCAVLRLMQLWRAPPRLPPARCAKELRAIYRSRRGTQPLISLGLVTGLRHHKIVRLFAPKGLASPSLQLSA